MFFAGGCVLPFLFMFSLVWFWVTATALGHVAEQETEDPRYDTK